MLYKTFVHRSVTVANPVTGGEDKCRVQRGYSWRLSRPSLMKKQKHRTGSDSDAVILNNGRDHAVCNGRWEWHKIIIHPLTTRWSSGKWLCRTKPLRSDSRRSCTGRSLCASHLLADFFTFETKNIYSISKKYLCTLENLVLVCLTVNKKNTKYVQIKVL